MRIVVYFIIGLTTVHMLEGYLLLQIHKGDNLSNVDALVHKQLPPSKFDELARAARNRFQNYKRYRIKGSPEDERVDSIVFAFRTDDEHLKKGNSRQENDVSDVLSYIKKIAGGLIGPDDDHHYRRSKLEKNIMIPPLNKRCNRNSEIMKNSPTSKDTSPSDLAFQCDACRNRLEQKHPSDGKPSLQYEVNTTSVLDTLSDALSSNQARRYSDGVAKAAAYVYNAIMEA